MSVTVEMRWRTEKLGAEVDLWVQALAPSPGRLLQQQRQGVRSAQGTGHDRWQLFRQLNPDCRSAIFARS